MSRSAKKGPYVDEKLYKKVQKLNDNRAKQPIRTWARACTIIPEFMGHTFEVHNRNKLYVAKAHADPGPTIKRFQPKDRGKAYSIMKRTSHLVVEVDQREE